MALIGTALANKRAGNHIITTSIEHASVLSPLAYLEEQGFRVTYLTVDENGQISLDELRDAVCEDTILVSMMMVNNEIGAVEPIAEAAKIVKEKNPNTIIHVDAIQAYGKYRICPKKLGIDLLSVSGHKIHAPKGTGFLYIKDKTKIKPIIYGGGQQKGMRSGTENVPGAAALGEAAMEIYENFDEKIAHMYALKKHFIEEVTKIEGVTINGKTGEDSAPQIVSVTIQGVRSEVMLHSLEEKEIYVSAGREQVYTTDDIYALPDGERAELIDGQIYMMGTPSRIHQKLVAQLSRIIGNYIGSNHGSCEIHPAPFAVFIKKDDKNYVEPDISVICDKNKLSDRGCEGAPDFIIEIVSPSSRRMDYYKKCTLYAESGVREYWIVDPEKQRTMIYRYEDDAAPMIVPFEQDLAVGIYNDFMINVSKLL